MALLLFWKREGQQSSELRAVGPWDRVEERRREWCGGNHHMTRLAVERNSRTPEVQMLMMSVQRDCPVTCQVNALPDPDQVRHPVDQADLGSLQQQVRVTIKLVLVSHDW